LIAISRTKFDENDKMEINFTPNYSGLFNDTRLEARAINFWSQLSIRTVSVVRQLSKSPSEQKAFYRFLTNPKVSEEKLIEEATGRVKHLCDNSHVLCIQDTSEINLINHRNRIDGNSGLGRSDNSQIAYCFKLHPGLVINAETLAPLGYSAIKIFNRDHDKPYRLNRNYKKQPIEDKESYKWIEIPQISKETLQRASMVTFIEDREGDIFEQFALVPDSRTHLIIRSRTTRKLLNGEDMYESVLDSTIAGTYKINIPSEKRTGQNRREATIQVRFIECKIQRPRNLNKEKYPVSIPLYCISAVEEGKSSTKINWKLLTTHKIETFDQALQIIKWYSSRWNIEQVFRLLKKDGFGIEESELESGWSIRKLVIMQLTVILKILQMNLSFSDPTIGLPIKVAFDDEQIKLLEIMNADLEGSTEKQKNPYNKTSIKWAAWIIGRMGGWKGYVSQGIPGVITLKIGQEQFNKLLIAVRIIKDVGTQ
jgi:hypothetical protein